jgi:hypothetical protein
MRTEPQKYIKMLTYKIVHFLAMASRIYLKLIKLKWIINDIGNIYLQDIIEIKISELPFQMIRFKLPPKEENMNFYKDGEHFI